MPMPFAESIQGAQVQNMLQPHAYPSHDLQWGAMPFSDHASGMQLLAYTLTEE
jgi:hypothetical protein